MGNDARSQLKSAVLAALSLTLVCDARVVFAALPSLETVRNQINHLERELLQTRESNLTASNQLRKIRRLLSLQQKEIELSQKKIEDLTNSLEDLSTQKAELEQSVQRQKVELRRKLRQLDKLSDAHPLDATWMHALDTDNQKTYFLSKTLKKDLARISKLKKDVQAALALELRIIEEKNKLDYYVNELQGQRALLSANEEAQREIIATNRASRLEALRRMQALKQSERELEKMLVDLRDRKEEGQTPDSQMIDISLAALKGKLPLPVEAPVLSGFGKSFDPKTNLLRFQKGITLGATPSSEVRAIAAGKVAYAGPLKNYGRIVIVEHPGKYYSLYGQMGDVNVKLGDSIQPGDVMGKTAGEPLYFEIRNKNVAINPLQWLSKGSINLSKH